MGIFNPIFQYVPTSIPISFGNGIGFVFGNITLLNSFLPITELFALAGIAITVKTAMLGYKVIMWMFSITNTVRQTFLTFRL